MTPKEIKHIQELINIAVVDPNHTGIKQLNVLSADADMDGWVSNGDVDTIAFKLVKAYNLGYGIPEHDGELHLYEHLKEKINVLVDAGARDDTYFLTESHTEYHLFEPDSINLAGLKENLKNVHKDINVKVNDVGLGDKTGTYKFYDSEGRNGTFCPPVQIEGLECPSNISYNLIRLDDYAKENKIEHVDFLKIDVEGYELEVLKGAGDLLYNTNYVQFEYANTFQKVGITLKEVCQHLHKFGLIHFYVVCTNGLIKLDSYHDHYMMMNVLAARDIEELKEIINISTLYPIYN